MKNFVFLFVFMILAAMRVVTAQNVCCIDFKMVDAGSVMPSYMLENVDLERFFTCSEIDDEIFERIEGISYKTDCPLPISELRYLKVLHYGMKGEIKVGEMICNKSISDDLLAIFRVLYENKYKIEKMVLIDDYDADDNVSMRANNSSSFNFRYISGTKKVSKHGLGLAVDINPLYNPYVKVRNGQTVVQPSEASDFVDRNADFPCKITREDLCYKEFIKRGFVWGGSWSTVKDYQHFEKK